MQVPAVQTIPHAPQFAGSVAVSVHPVLQDVCPAGQTHNPAVQTWPGAHAMLQLPQLLTSVLVSVQLDPHWVRPTAQLVLHWPSEQTWPGGQTLPHMPQLSPSVVKSTQAKPQGVRSAEHEQTPATQT
jgi:hypothetical protein